MVFVRPGLAGSLTCGSRRLRVHSVFTGGVARRRSWVHVYTGDSPAVPVLLDHVETACRLRDRFVLLEARVEGREEKLQDRIVRDQCCGSRLEAVGDIEERIHGASEDFGRRFNVWGPIKGPPFGDEMRPGLPSPRSIVTIDEPLIDLESDLGSCRNRCGRVRRATVGLRPPP